MINKMVTNGGVCVQHHICFRFAFYIFNLAFWILGWGSLGVGLWLYIAKNSYSALAPANFGAMSAAGLCIAAGITVVVIGFVGCCGAWVESKCLLLTVSSGAYSILTHFFQYIIFVSLLFIIQLATGGMGLIYRQRVHEIVRQELLANLNSPYVSETSTDPYGIRITWDKMQQELECCGVDGYADWYESARWPRNKFVPDSCCRPEHFRDGNNVNCGKLDTNKERWFQQGCYAAFSDWLLDHMRAVGIIGIVFAVVEILELVCAVILLCSICRHKHNVSVRTSCGAYANGSCRYKKHHQQQVVLLPTSTTTTTPIDVDVADDDR